MIKGEDSFAWAVRLGCPASALTEPAKKSLSKGIASLLWDHVADKLYPTLEVSEAKKNILLYKIEKQEKDDDIQSIEGRVKLRADRRRREEQMTILEKQTEEQHLSLCKKRQRLLEIKAAREKLRDKRALLSIKYEQMQTDIEDCKRMQQVARCLLPATGENVEQGTVEEALKLVSSLTFGADRKQVWNQISNMLSPVAVPVLWHTLLQNRAMDTDRLITLGAETCLENVSNTDGEKFEIGIAKACGQHVSSVSTRVIQTAKATDIQQRVLQHINAIETSAQRADLDISEWLALTLELRKYEVEQNALRNAVKEIGDTLEVRNQLNAEMNQIAGTMQNIDHEMRTCAQQIQTSLVLLKSANETLSNIHIKLLGGLHKFYELRSQERDNNWMDNDLSIEVEYFYKRFDINALKKVALEGDVRAYRHAACCIGQAPLANSSLIQSRNTSDSYFLRAPIYNILDCYKNQSLSVWIANDKLRSAESADSKSLSIDDLEKQCCSMISKTNNDALRNLLAHIKKSYQAAYKEFEEFDRIFDAWSHQIVGNILMYDDRTVNGSTFKEWHYRFGQMQSLLASRTKALK